MTASKKAWSSRESRWSLRWGYAATLVGLALVWVLLWGSLSWGTVVLALVVAALVLAAFPLPVPRSRFRIRPLAVAALFLRFLFDLVKASFVVGWQAIRPQRMRQGRILDVQLRSADDLCCTLVAEITSLVPGTVVIDLDATTRILTMHVLDTCDDQRARREAQHVKTLERRVEHALGLDRTPETEAR